MRRAILILLTLVALLCVSPTFAQSGGGGGNVRGTGIAGKCAQWTSSNTLTSAAAACGSGGGGPTASCDASTITNYAPAVCVLTLNTAQLNALNGTPVSAILTPGASKAIVPSGSIYAEYIASSIPFGAMASFDFGFGASLTESFALPYSSTLDFTNAAKQFAYGSSNPLGTTGPQTDSANTALYIGLSANIGTGPIATTTLNAGGVGYAANDTGTVSTGNSDATYIVNTVSAGNGAIVSVSPTPNPAGSGYAINDTGVLTHGSGTAAYIVDSVGTAGPIVTAVPNASGLLYTVGDIVEVLSAGAPALGIVSSMGAGGAVTGIVFPASGSVVGNAVSGTGSGGTQFSIGTGLQTTLTGGQATCVSMAAVHTAGSGYAVGDTGTISGGGDGAAHYYVTAIGGGGSVSAFVIDGAGNEAVNWGSGYSIASNVMTTVATGAGDGAFTVDVTAVNTGNGDSNLTIDITAIAVGVSTFHLTSFGTGYSIETGSPTATGGGQPGSGTGFAIDISSVNAGIVLTYTITGDGTGYATGTGVATSTGGGQPGSGTGLLLNITGVTQGNGSAKVIIPYTVVPTS